MLIGKYILMNSKSREKVGGFALQATESFPNGAPQREEYSYDLWHEIDCRRYAEEWRARYECPGCLNPDCPQCGKN